MVSLLSAAAVVLSGCTSADQGETSQSSQTFSPRAGDGAQEPKADSGPTFENGVLTTPDIKIKIERFKVIPAGAKGNEYSKKPVIAFWYTTTNLTNADVDPTEFLFHFTAYQDNNPNAMNELDVGMLPDDRFLDSQMGTIKKGGTVENAVSYELDDLKTPVDLVATEGFDDKIGQATFVLR